MEVSVVVRGQLLQIFFCLLGFPKKSKVFEKIVYSLLKTGHMSEVVEKTQSSMSAIGSTM